MTKIDQTLPAKGMLAAAAGRCFPLDVCRSAAGFYIGTRDEEGLPYSRESEEYWRKPEQAAQALQGGTWTQRRNP